MPFPILFGTTVTTVLHYRADCDHRQSTESAHMCSLWGVVGAFSVAHETGNGIWATAACRLMELNIELCAF